MSTKEHVVASVTTKLEMDPPDTSYEEAIEPLPVAPSMDTETLAATPASSGGHDDTIASAGTGDGDVPACGGGLGLDGGGEGEGEETCARPAPGRVKSTRSHSSTAERGAAAPIVRESAAERGQCEVQRTKDLSRQMRTLVRPETLGATSARHAQLSLAPESENNEHKCRRLVDENRASPLCRERWRGNSPTFRRECSSGAFTRTGWGQAASSPAPLRKDPFPSQADAYAQRRDAAAEGCDLGPHDSAGGARPSSRHPLSRIKHAPN